MAKVKKKKREEKNPFRIDNEAETVIIILNNGYSTTIDLKDWPVVSKHRWHASHRRDTYLIKSNVPNENSKPRPLYLHRLIMGNPEFRVRHIDGDEFNNRRSNLEIIVPVTKSKPKSTTAFFGVYRVADDKNVSSIRHPETGKRIYLERSDSQEACARAFDLASIVIKGSTTRLNFPRKEYSKKEIERMAEYIKKKIT